MDNDWDTLARHISDSSKKSFSIKNRRSINGGCINKAMVLEDGPRCYFLKQNAATRLAMFEAEAKGLQEIARSHSVRVPEPVCWGKNQNFAYLVLEYIDIGAINSHGMQQLGFQLAQMHRTTRAHFGWDTDNTIGSTPQMNTPSPNWVNFWRENRLGFQLELAGQNGRSLNRKGERLLADLEKFFQGYSPAPSLLHGDLWGGNAGSFQQQPVIFDPAVYYGDRETDLAMTELFGGFSAAFYGAYEEAWPLDAGYRVRKSLYNLYHILNHFNLFGGGYASQAEHMMDSLLSELR